jgi:hypothetical protein
VHIEGYGFVEQYFGAQNHDFRSMLDGVSKVNATDEPNRQRQPSQLKQERIREVSHE